MGIKVERQFLERDGYFLSPLAFPGPPSLEELGLESLHTPGLFCSALFPSGYGGRQGLVGSTAV